jgi:hypothetical protein
MPIKQASIRTRAPQLLSPRSNTRLVMMSRLLYLLLLLPHPFLGTLQILRCP